MKGSELKTAIQELADGRAFAHAQIAAWLNRVRKSVAMDFEIAGFNGLYFLYKEATVKDGSVKGQGKYAMPDDFIDHLDVFYEKALLVKAPPGMLSLTQDRTARGIPQWFRIVGQEFELMPWPDAAGKEILLFYNGVPDEIPITENGLNNFTDYFTKHFPDLHIYGGGKYAAQSLGHPLADKYSGYFDAERKRLRNHNVRHYTSHTKIRFQNWDEYTEQKMIVFPQFQET